MDELELVSVMSSEDFQRFAKRETRYLLFDRLHPKTANIGRALLMQFERGPLTVDESLELQRLVDSISEMDPNLGELYVISLDVVHDAKMENRMRFSALFRKLVTAMEFHHSLLHFMEWATE